MGFDGCLYIYDSNHHPMKKLFVFVLVQFSFLRDICHLKNALFLIALMLLLFGSCARRECDPVVEAVMIQDSTMMDNALQYRSILLNRFAESALAQNGQKQYHFMFYSSHGYGRSVKIMERDRHYFIRVHCFMKKEMRAALEKDRTMGRPGIFDEALDDVNFEIEITDAEWMLFEYEAYKAEFWNIQPIDTTERKVLDGTRYIVEGSRPTDGGCIRKGHQLLFRNHQGGDAAGRLIDGFLNIEDFLSKKYGFRKDPNKTKSNTNK